MSGESVPVPGPLGKWRIGMRLARRRASHSFGTVLALIVVSLVFAATAPDASWTASVLILLQSLTLVAALWTAGLARGDSWLSISLLVVAVVVAILTPVIGGSTLVGIASILSGLLILGVAGVVARSITLQAEVNAQSVLGAICVYLLAGMIFLFVYGAVAALGSGPFFAQGMDGTRSLRLYFSYVTLATLGYGDYTPAGNLGHMLAILEALIGQLYLVTVIALLVARMRVRKDA